MKENDLYDCNFFDFKYINYKSDFIKYLNYGNNFWISKLQRFLDFYFSLR